MIECRVFCQDWAFRQLPPCYWPVLHEHGYLVFFLHLFCKRTFVFYGHMPFLSPNLTMSEHRRKLGALNPVRGKYLLASSFFHQPWDGSAVQEGHMTRKTKSCCSLCAGYPLPVSCWGFKLRMSMLASQITILQTHRLNGNNKTPVCLLLELFCYTKITILLYAGVHVAQLNSSALQN